MVKWRQFYNKIVNKYRSDMELIFSQLTTHDKTKLVQSLSLVTMATVVNSCNYVT